MSLNLNGLHIVVTGGTGALGTAIVEQLVDEGATCHVPCFSEAELARFPYTKAERVRVTPGVNLAEEASTAAYYGQFAGGARLWASIHVAGGFSMGAVGTVSADDFRRQWEMNTLTCFLCCREAVRSMRGHGGRLVNVASRPGVIPSMGANMVAYTASKAAVCAITESLGAELAGEGIWVNAVAPSVMDTPANRAAMPTADFAAWPKVHEVARTICFLASPLNQATRGGIVPVYGRS